MVMCFEDQVTNESLDAIVSGLRISAGDSVLCICGSGDQAFAISEKASKVIAVDKRPNQISHIMKRMAYLESGDFASFLAVLLFDEHPYDPKVLEERNAYFSKERLQKIMERLQVPDVLSGAVGNIFDGIFGDHFDKIYLSNAISYDSSNQDIRTLRWVLSHLASLMPPGGLMYISDGRHVVERNRLAGYDIFKDTGLAINESLSKNTQRIQAKS